MFQVTIVGRIANVPSIVGKEKNYLATAIAVNNYVNGEQKTRFYDIMYKTKGDNPEKLKDIFPAGTAVVASCYDYSAKVFKDVKGEYHPDVTLWCSRLDVVAKVHKEDYPVGSVENPRDITPGKMDPIAQASAQPQPFGDLPF